MHCVQVHVFQTMPFLDAARRAFLSAREFARDVLINVGNDSTETLQGNTEEVLEHGRQPAAEVLGQRVELLVDEAVVRVLRFGYAVARPVEAAGGQEVDEHQRERLHVVAPGGHYG